MNTFKNHRKPPIICAIGEKFRQAFKMGKAIRPHELEHAFAVLIDGRNFAQYKLMMFLTGNAPGYKMYSANVCERCGITEKNYKLARKALVERGWLSFEPTKKVTVNYDKIYSDYEKYIEENQMENFIEDEAQPEQMPEIIDSTMDADETNEEDFSWLEDGINEAYFSANNIL